MKSAGIHGVSLSAFASESTTKQTSVKMKANIWMWGPPSSTCVLHIHTTAGGHHVTTYKPALILYASWQITEM